MNILIVDDDPAITQLITAELTDEGFDVMTATNGQEALARVAESLPDGIVLDLEMPVMDGRACFRALRARGVTTPVLLLSAHGAVSAQHELGADDAMNKPFDPEQLSAHVHELVESQHAPPSERRPLRGR